MADERIFRFDLKEEVNRFFDASSLPAGKAPSLVIVMGGVCVGKTTFRKQQFPTGYVVLDAGEIFLHLSRGEFFPFPGPLEDPMEMIGRMVAQRAVSERRNIVLELLGAEPEPVNALIPAMKALGYEVDIRFLDCAVEEMVRRNAARGPDDISSYFAEPFHRRWLQEAAQETTPSP